LFCHVNVDFPKFLNVFYIIHNEIVENKIIACEWIIFYLLWQSFLYGYYSLFHPNISIHLDYGKLLKQIKVRYAKTNLSSSQKKRGLKNLLKHPKIINDKCIVLCLVDGSGIGATDSYRHKQFNPGFIVRAPHATKP
jgi:hypothetical protein